VNEFLLITTPEWVEVPNFDQVLLHVASADTVQGWITDQEWSSINQFAEDTGILPAGRTIVDARLFITGDDATPVRFWMVTQPT
jgi:hypothetical protein